MKAVIYILIAILFMIPILFISFIYILCGQWEEAPIYNYPNNIWDMLGGD